MCWVWSEEEFAVLRVVPRVVAQDELVLSVVNLTSEVFGLFVGEHERSAVVSTSFLGIAHERLTRDIALSGRDGS